MPRKSVRKSRVIRKPVNKNKEELIPEEKFVKQLYGGDTKWINNSNIALAVYQTDIGYKALNTYLRKNPFSSSDHIVNLIDKGMNNKQKGIQVFRGIRQSDNFRIAPFTSYGEYGYSSVSPNFCSAVKFSRGDCCVLSFEISKDILSYDYKDNPYKFFSNEQEILVQRNIVYHIGEPVIINQTMFYPCVVIKMENTSKLKKLIDKQSEFLRNFSVDYNKIKSGSAEEILENLEKNRPYQFLPLLPNLESSYDNLCLDKKMYAEVEKLAKEKYKK